MKKILLFAVMAVMAITANAQGSPKVYSGQPMAPGLTKNSLVKKSFQSQSPKMGLTTRSYAPTGRHLTLDPNKVKPVTRAKHNFAQPIQQMQGKAFGKGKAQSRQMVNLTPTLNLNKPTSARAKAPAFAETYIGMGINYRSKEVEEWTMTPSTKTFTNKDTGEEREANVLVNVIPTPDFLSDLFPDGIPVEYTIEDDVITISPQAIASYKNEAQDSTFYITLFSANSDDEDGIINMTLGEDGKLAITNGNWVCLGEFANVEFDPDMSDGDAYLGWDELYANVTYYYRYESSINYEYNAHAVDYFANQPEDWVMQRGTVTMDEEETHFFVNMSPLIDTFADLYPDGIDVEYTQEGNVITVKPQVIASYEDEEEGGADGMVYILICSGTADDGCIVLTEGEDGSLTTIANESVILGAWSTKEFDASFDTYLGSYSYMDNVKYRLPNAAPEAPEDAAFESNELVLFAGMGPSGYSYNSNLAVFGAYTPVSFRNNTFDIATDFEWTITENPEEEDEAVITGKERNFSFNTKGGSVYTDFSLIASNEGAQSEPFTWGKGLSFAKDANGNDTNEKRYEDVYFYGGHGQGSFKYSDDTYATMTRQNPDLDLTFYVNFATPNILDENEQFASVARMTKIYSYQGKPSTPLYLTGVTLPMVSFEAQEDFNLHISLYKCTRTSTGNLTLGDLIAEGDATTDNVQDYESGISEVEFNELYREDEFGMSETLDYLFIEDEFCIVIDGWDNGTFKGVLGNQEYSNNEITSTWFQTIGQERMRSYGGGWPTLFIGLKDATYGYLYTEDNTDLQFAANGGEATIHIDPMYYTVDEETEEPTYSLSIEKITVDGEEEEEIPEWLTIEIANEDYTTATDIDEDGEEYEYFVNGIDYDMIVTAEEMPEDVKSRKVEIVFMQTGARLKVTVTQGEGVVKQGDVNADGQVDVADISSILTIMAGEYDSVGDVNGDGQVDVADISTVLTIMAGGE
ncbi:MAG: dockerin type I repeat-containing protein [Prevotella sp.]|nr:dockerin type I repeat-containing protein [Prevotella sp.]